MNALSEAPMYIDDTPNISAMELRTKARRLQAEAGLDLVIVDYLQLMQATTTNRDANRVQEVSRDLARPQGARARAVDPGHRPLAAVAPARDARVEGAAPVGPARVGRDRAGRRPRDVPVAREGTRRRTTRTRRARSSTSGSPSTATARPARSSSGSRRSRPASLAMPETATQKPRSGRRRFSVRRRAAGRATWCLRGGVGGGRASRTCRRRGRLGAGRRNRPRRGRSRATRRRHG